MISGGWRLVVGGGWWLVAVGGWWSLGAVLDKTIGVLNDSPDHRIFIFDGLLFAEKQEWARGSGTSLKNGYAFVSLAKHALSRGGLQANG